MLVWINLDGKDEVDVLHARWCERGAIIRHPPESRPWSRLHEFVAEDPDGT